MNCAVPALAADAVVLVYGEATKAFMNSSSLVRRVFLNWSDFWLVPNVQVLGCNRNRNRP